MEGLRKRKREDKDKLLRAVSGKLISNNSVKGRINVDDTYFVWSNQKEKIEVIRQGLPYVVIDDFSKKTSVPIKHFLTSLNIKQTTYNKNKKEKKTLDRQDSEFIVELEELYNFGISVFNNEVEKFQRWLKKPNISLGNISPISLFDSLTGINEVKKALNRMEYGNLA